jgi:hypothetical protein
MVIEISIIAHQAAHDHGHLPHDAPSLVWPKFLLLTRSFRVFTNRVRKPSYHHSTNAESITRRTRAMIGSSKVGAVAKPVLWFS